ncbi:MAG: DUF2318 domain-containing protein [Planctomycetes bacterium]|nr:DUF2318 domain-containing protein [Planctomycetota bacterium]
MFESFVIMLREGVEAALVIGILLVVLRRANRRDLERPVYWGLALAVVGSFAAAYGLQILTFNEEAYEGALFTISAVFVGSMLVWMHARSRRLKADIEARVERATAGASAREAWGLGAFAFLMVFREGAETVLFLSAVSLTTDALLSFLGALAGLALAVLFCVFFVRGSLKVDLRRFFFVTECVLVLFIVQLLVNGYHEFSEAGVLPATKESMSLVGPIVRNNTIFVLALLAIPLFVWVSGPREAVVLDGLSEAERRLALARAKSERFYRYAATTTAIFILGTVGVVYAQEAIPRQLAPPEPAEVEGDQARVPIARLDDGELHRFGYLTKGRLVRFLAMRTGEGEIRTALDACEICGPRGFIQDGEFLLCANCEAEINPRTLGLAGGCNPIPLESRVEGGVLLIPVSDLEEHADLFASEGGREEEDPVCGMKVRVDEATAYEVHDGKVYYFCGMGGCRAKFVEEPDAFLK